MSGISVCVLCVLYVCLPHGWAGFNDTAVYVVPSPSPSLTTLASDDDLLMNVLFTTKR